MINFHIVWNGKEGRENYPLVIHETRMDADKEAHRLANKHKGETFYVMEKVYSALIIQNPLSRNGIIKKLKKLKDALNDSNVTAYGLEQQIEKLITRVKE